MSDPEDPGEEIPPRRIEAGNIVLYYNLADSEEKRRARIGSVDADAENQPASVFIFDDESTETGVPFAQGDFQPERGYVWTEQFEDGGDL